MFKNALIFFILLLQTSTLLAQMSIVLTTGEWEPFTSQSYKNSGIANAIVKEAFKIQNINVTYKFYPWKRAMFYAQIGKYEGSTIWMKTKQRELDFLYSKKPILIHSTTFFHLKKTHFNWNDDINYLKKFKIGTTLGYSYTQELNNAIKNNIIKPDIGLSDLKNLKKLLLGRIEVLICDEQVCLTLIKKYLSKNEQNQLTYSKKHLSTVPHFLILNKKQKKLKKEFDIGFKKLKESGRYQELITQIKKGEDYDN